MAGPEERQGGARGKIFSDAGGFVRSYTAGLRRRDLKRLFDEEAVDAYDILVRDQDGREPEGGLARAWHRIQTVFLGLSYKLSPARRLIFAGALLLALLGALDFGAGVFNFRNRIVFDAAPVWFLVSIAALCYILALELVDRVRYRDELEIARQLQRDLLPSEELEIEGYEIAHAYRTANEVGGDYYDFTRLADGRIAVMVGDASGHGIAAGLLMAIANATIKLAMDMDPRPVQVLNLLNRAMVQIGDRRAFMTLFYGVLQPETGELEYASAGHPFPILRRACGDREELGEGSLPLGIRDRLDIRSHKVQLEHQDAIVIYSDGLPEATDSGGHSFGYERLDKLLIVGGLPHALRERILHALENHREGLPLVDDFSLVVLGRLPRLPALPVDPNKVERTAEVEEFLRSG